MDIRVLSWWLLLGQIGSAFFILMVILRQIRLFRLRVPNDIVVFRQILFSLALVIFCGNVVPLTVSVLTILGLVTRSANYINGIGLYYTISNTAVAFFSAILIWLLYRMAAQTVLITEDDEEVVLETK